MYTKIHIELFKLIALYIYNGNLERAGELLEMHFDIKE
jgi:hypothetical protein